MFFLFFSFFWVSLNFLHPFFYRRFFVFVGFYVIASFGSCAFACSGRSDLKDGARNLLNIHTLAYDVSPKVAGS